jgi:hypothetical protein
MITSVTADDWAISRVGVIKSGGLTTTTVEDASPVRGPLSFLATDLIQWIIESFPRTTDRVGSAAYMFAKKVSALREVEAVTHVVDRNVNIIWTFIGRRDKAVRRLIYQQEMAIMQDFPDLIFDFNVVSLDQIAKASLLPEDVQGHIVLFQKFAI